MTGGLLPDSWAEPDPELLDKLTEHGAAGADLAVIMLGLMPGTDAQRTRTAVRSALRVLLANGLVTAVPPDQWPEYVYVPTP